MQFDVREDLMDPPFEAVTATQLERLATDARVAFASDPVPEDAVAKALRDPSATQALVRAEVALARESSRGTRSGASW